MRVSTKVSAKVPIKKSTKKKKVLLISISHDFVAKISEYETALHTRFFYINRKTNITTLKLHIINALIIKTKKLKMCKSILSEIGLLY